MNKVVAQQVIAPKPHILSPIVMGYIAIGIVLLVWSGFSLTVRAIGASNLTIADVALIRFTVPLIVLLPLLPKRIAPIKTVSLSNFLLILLGGIPFFFLAATGAKSVPTAYVGTILAGTPPFFVAVLGYCFFHQLVSKTKLVALLLIMLGVFAMILGQSGPISTSVLDGVFWLMLGSIVWASYTIGLKDAGLDPISIALILSMVSFFVLVILIVFGLLDSNFGQFSLLQAMPFLLIQGLGVGLIATLGYSYAVSQLGSSQSSIIGSLSPGVTAILAVPVFGESLSLAIVIGIFFTTCGVIFSNR